MAKVIMLFDGASDKVCASRSAWCEASTNPAISESEDHYDGLTTSTGGAALLQQLALC
jgi:hypothetical protein